MILREQNWFPVSKLLLTINLLIVSKFCEQFLWAVRIFCRRQQQDNRAGRSSFEPARHETGNGFCILHSVVCTSVRLYFYTSILQYFYTSILLYVYTSIRLYVYTSIRLYVYTSIRLYVYTSVRLYVCTFLRFYVCTSVRRYDCSVQFPYQASQITWIPAVLVHSTYCRTPCMSSA